MTINSLLSSPPKVHNWRDGVLTSTGLPTSVFEFMNKILTSESITLETGIGISTAIFALGGGKHTCVGPDQNEINRFKDYALKNALSVENITFCCKRSCDVWNDFKDNHWDLILIDGCHGFPTPFLDWYFFTQGLKVNGYVVIDDTHISTGKMLMDFLLKEDSWQIVDPFTDKTAIFKKLKQFDYNKEFIDQPFIVDQTKRINKYKKLKNLRAKLRSMVSAKRLI
jgi:hypothetical protein